MKEFESFALSHPKSSLIHAHSHNGHAMAYKYSSKDADDPRAGDSAKLESPAEPPINPLSNAKKPPAHMPDDYCITDPWSSSPVQNTWEKLPVTPLPDGKGYARAGAYQSMTGRKSAQGNWVTDETASNYGPVPMGWYGLWVRSLGNNNIDMRTSWDEEGSRPQTNHHRNANDNFLGFVQWGSYCQRAMPGNHNIEDKGCLWL